MPRAKSLDGSSNRTSTCPMISCTAQERCIGWGNQEGVPCNRQRQPSRQKPFSGGQIQVYGRYGRCAMCSTIHPIFGTHVFHAACLLVSLRVVCVHHYCVCFCGVFHPCVPSMKGCVWMLLENSQVFRCAFACVCVLWVVLWDSAITTVMWLLLDKLTLPLPS